ncbi:MAG: hypothetical protein ACREKH_15340 [Candidatus Rokuibacteriota bacterium]
MIVATVPADTEPRDVEQVRRVLGRRFAHNTVLVVSDSVTIDVHRPGEDLRRP